MGVSDEGYSEGNPGKSGCDRGKIYENFAKKLH